MVLFLTAGPDGLMSLDAIGKKIQASQKIISSPAYQKCKLQVAEFSKQIDVCEPSEALALKEEINKYFTDLNKTDPLLYSDNFSLAHKSLISRLVKKQTGMDVIID